MMGVFVQTNAGSRYALHWPIGYLIQENGCWEWVGARDSRGYGRVHDPETKQSCLAHRWVYEHQVGAIPDGLTLDHLCRNPTCVRPDHLEPVSQHVNVMRGEGVAARCAVKTHCKYGHPFVGHNVKVTVLKNGRLGRRCRVCHNRRNRRLYHALRGSLALLLATLSACITDQSPTAFDPPSQFAANVSSLGAGDYTVMYIPDTQYYAASFPGTWAAQVAWIASRRDSLNIVFVSHLGDVVDNVGVPAEWQTASDAMAALDSVVPVGVAPGNHDIENGWGGSTGSWATYRSWFPPSRYPNAVHYVPHIGRASSYQTITVGTENLLFLHLEFQAPDDVLAWARGVVDAHPNHRVHVSTHSYLNRYGVRFPSHTYLRANGNPGEAIWQELVRRSPNIRLVHSAHICAEARAVSTNDAGEAVDEILADYQCGPNGGDGWLRFYVFKPSVGEIHAYTYSPTRDEFDTDAQSQFVLPYNPGTTSVPPPPPPSADQAIPAVTCGPLKPNGKADCTFDASASTGSPIVWLKCPTCFETSVVWSQEVTATPVYRSREWSLVAGIDTTRFRFVAPDSGLVEVFP